MSLELAPHGSRVVGLPPQAILESRTMQRVFELKAAQAMSWEQRQQGLAQPHPRRPAQQAAGGRQHGRFPGFGPGERAEGTTVNLSLGALDD